MWDLQLLLDSLPLLLIFQGTCAEWSAQQAWPLGMESLQVYRVLLIQQLSYGDGKE